MNERNSISRIRWLALVVSLAFVSGVLALRQWRPFAADDTSLTALAAEKARLVVTLEERTRLVQELAARQKSAAAKILPPSLPAGWAWKFQSVDRVIFATNSPVPAWHAILATIAELERQPGWQLAQLDLRTGGDRRQRAIASMEISLERATPMPARPVDLRPPSAPAPAAEPAQAGARKVGRVPSLRRPAASADRRAARLRLPARTALRPGPTLRAGPA